jgi:hypothetical protein
VETFANYFDDTLDRMALVSFASTKTLDLPMQLGQFKAPIKTAVDNMNFNGATFADGGLQEAVTQNASVPPSPTIKMVYVAVFFTDGHANTIQDTLNCGGIVGNGLINYGGYDSPPDVGYMRPTGASQNPICTESGNTCCSAKFPSQKDGKLEPINWNKVSSDSSGDAQYRAVQTANTLRATNGTVVYSIGLGNDINNDFLYQVANDPNSSTYDATKPVGQAVFAPTAADLQQAFQIIASQILLRLSQ